jgi:hypothetical protein
MNPRQLFQSSAATLAASITVVGHVVVGGLERRTADRERGDVPGWVLITLMTAGLVTILWSLAATQLTALFSKAMTSVTGP